MVSEDCIFFLEYVCNQSSWQLTTALMNFFGFEIVLLVASVLPVLPHIINFPLRNSPSIGLCSQYAIFNSNLNLQSFSYRQFITYCLVIGLRFNFAYCKTWNYYPPLFPSNGLISPCDGTQHFAFFPHSNHEYDLLLVFFKLA